MQKEAQTRCETWFQFHISGHLWYRDSGMHSCSDKRGSWSDLVLLSIYVSTPASRRRKKITKKKKNKPTYSTTLLFGLRERGEEEGREGEMSLFLNSWALQGSGWEQSEMQRLEKESERVSRASSSPGRKEEFPLASDCLTCKNVAFVAGLCSIFLAGLLWPAVSFFSVASRLFLPTQFLWILLGYSPCRGTQLIGLSDTVHTVQLSFF